MLFHPAKPFIYRKNFNFLPTNNQNVINFIEFINLKQLLKNIKVASVLGCLKNVRIHINIILKLFKIISFFSILNKYGTCANAVPYLRNHMKSFQCITGKNCENNLFRLR